MRYSGENCPYCGVTFADGDDIVVCPECATPHHRACWHAHGQCANTEKHAENFVWKKAAAAQPGPEKTNEEEPDKKSLDIVCPDCGKVSPNGTLRCPDCGAMLIPFSPLGEDSPVARFVPGFDPNEQIGRLKSGDIALYCRVGGTRYIKAFRKLNEKRKFSWNWGAAFFAPYWFFYRKLYKAGAIFLALFAAVSLWLMPASSAFYEEYDNLAIEVQRLMEEEGENAAMARMEEKMPELVTAMQPMLLPMLIQLLLHIAAAFAADRLYFKKAKADILQVKSENHDARNFQLELFKKGGTTFVGGALSYFGYEIVLYAASWLMNR